MKKDPLAPPDLFSMQRWFGKLISSPVWEKDSYHLPLLPEQERKEADQHISKGPVLSPSQRLAIYHQQYWFRLVGLVQAIFPTLLRLFGYKEFNQRIAVPFIAEHPPHEWTLNFFGQQLVTWIKKAYQEEDREFVICIAELDEAFYRLISAKEKTILRKKKESLVDKTYFLQSTIALFHWNGDLFSFRKKMLSEDETYWLEKDFPKIEWGKPLYFLLWRDQDDHMDNQTLSRGEFLLLTTFQNGSNLENALALLSSEPKSLQNLVEKKLVSWFQMWVKNGWLI